MAGNALLLISRYSITRSCDICLWKLCHDFVNKPRVIATHVIFVRRKETNILRYVGAWDNRTKQAGKNQILARSRKYTNKKHKTPEQRRGIIRSNYISRKSITVACFFVYASGFVLAVFTPWCIQLCLCNNTHAVMARG